MVGRLLIKPFSWYQMNYCHTRKTPIWTIRLPVNSKQAELIKIASIYSINNGLFDILIPILSLAIVTLVSLSNEVAKNNPKSSALSSNSSGPIVGLLSCTLSHPGWLRVYNTLFNVSAIV